MDLGIILSRINNKSIQIKLVNSHSNFYSLTFFKNGIEIGFINYNIDGFEIIDISNTFSIFTEDNLKSIIKFCLLTDEEQGTVVWNFIK